MLVGRVVTEYRASYIVAVNNETLSASVRGQFHIDDVNEFPKVGDEVVLERVAEGKAVISEILPRRSVISREREDGTTQVMVTNVDYVLIVMGLDNDFNVRRLERYRTLALSAGVKPVIILNKTDLVDSLESKLSAVKAVAEDTPILAISAKSEQGLEQLSAFLRPGQTVVLLGSSGAGKSTLTNALMKSKVQTTRNVRVRDDRGTHTTTTRQLFTLPSGAYLIDTPGMRELGVETLAEKIELAFPDIAELARKCRFNNCDHDKSQGCALLEAVNKGEIDMARVEQYKKLLSGGHRTRKQRYGSK